MSTGSGGAGNVGGGVATGGGGAGGCGGCDVDCDGHDATACGGDDCDDLDKNVHPGQTKWFETPRTNGTYDYNCNGADEQEFPTFACSGTVCANMMGVFLSVAPLACGQTAPFGDCALLLCAATVTDATKIVRCR